MCGILGYLGKRSFDAAAFWTALDLMERRGPDDRGIFEEPEVLLGVRRLAILDLTPAGHQPMVSHDGRYVAVHNGEVYNFREIRSRLEAAGERFTSNSDTEVILADFVSKGPACLDDFRGMFALAIYDCRERSLFLARDRMAIKPLYIWRFPGGIAFASEVKALRALPGGPSTLDPRALWKYLLWGSVPEPLTVLEGVECLPPATWAVWKDGATTQRSYWDFPSGSLMFTRREETLEALRPALREAVALRCIADVPVGAFLSGGVDSSSVVSLMRAGDQRDLRTFSISFAEKELDEGPFALGVAQEFGTTHTDVALTEQTVRGRLDDFFAAMDQPTSNGLNTYLVSKCAHDAGLKVALSGLGGDELFAGYPSFRRITRARRWLSWVPRGVARIGSAAARGRDGRVGKLEALGMRGDCVGRLYFADRGLFMPSQARQLMSDGLGSRVDQALVGADCDAFALGRPEEAATGPDTLHLTMLLELRRYMRNQLLRDSDVFGMANSLEIRVPLIDHAVVEILFRIDPGIVTHGRGKELLLEALPSPLPRACTDRPKMGFTFPLGRWMRGPWRQAFEGTLLAFDRLPGKGEPLFNKGAVEHLWHSFLAGRVHWSRPWSVYALTTWMKAWG